VIWGTGKATSVQKFAAEHGVDLRSSYFYADGDEDLALMYLVGNPRPVNPGPELTKVAERRGWPILRFSSRGGGGPLAGSATWRDRLARPGGGRRAEPGVLTRNKRVGVNFLTRYWPEAVLTLSGVTLNVTGEENLTAQRPAVFPVQPQEQLRHLHRGRAGQGQLDRIAKKELEPTRWSARSAS